FYAMAAESMRRILIDHARKRGAKKRGGGQGIKRLSLDLAQVAATADLTDVLAVDEAIRELAKNNARAAEVVRMRFFVGLDEAATAKTLELSERTVRREWAYARAWLYRRLASE